MESHAGFLPWMGQGNLSNPDVTGDYPSSVIDGTYTELFVNLTGWDSNSSIERDPVEHPDGEMSFDYSQVPYFGELKRPKPAEAGIKIAMYIFIILWSIVGNGLVIFIVWKTPRMRTTTNYYLVNLAVADLLVTLMCSWVHIVDDLTEGWVLGAFFCKANSFGQVLALVSSILTLTLIACDRFFGIVFAMRAHLTERRASICLLAVWLCALCVSSPLLAFRTQHIREWANHTEIWCDDTWPALVELGVSGQVVGVSYPSRTFYYTFVSVVLFFLPIIVMTTAYSFIVLKLWSSTAPGERIEAGKIAQDRVKRKVAVMLIILLVIFVICWLPLQAAILYSEYRPHPLTPLPVWYSHFKYAATFIAYSNSALNPIIYAGFNDNFQRGLKGLFRRPQHTSRRYSSMASTTYVSRRESPTMITKI